MNRIKQLILEKYKSINSFIQQTQTTISRTTMYRLLNNTTENPTRKTVEELARITGLSIEEVFNEYNSDRHRNQRLRDEL